MYQDETAIFNNGHDIYIDEGKNPYQCRWNSHHTAPIKLERGWVIFRNI